MNLLFVWSHADYAARGDSVGIVRSISHHLCKMNCIALYCSSIIIFLAFGERVWFIFFIAYCSSNWSEKHVSGLTAIRSFTAQSENSQRSDRLWSLDLASCQSVILTFCDLRPCQVGLLRPFLPHCAFTDQFLLGALAGWYVTHCKFGSTKPSVGAKVGPFFVPAFSEDPHTLSAVIQRTALLLGSVLDSFSPSRTNTLAISSSKSGHLCFMPNLFWPEPSWVPVGVVLSFLWSLEVWLEQPERFVKLPLSVLWTETAFKGRVPVPVRRKVSVACALKFNQHVKFLWDFYWSANFCDSDMSLWFFCYFFFNFWSHLEHSLINILL